MNMNRNLPSKMKKKTIRIIRIRISNLMAVGNNNKKDILKINSMLQQQM